MKGVAGRALPVLAAAAIVFLASAAGCARHPAKNGPVKLTIAFQEFVGYGPIYLARDMGFLADEGVELVFIDEQLDSARRDAFAEGMLDCELGTMDLLVAKRALGVPVVSAAALDHSAGADGIAAAECIRTPKDLAGKSVAFARDDVGESLLCYVLDREGLSLADIKAVPCAPNEVAGIFRAGGADAAVTWEPELSRALERPGSRLLVSSAETPGLILDSFNVREDIVKKYPGAVKAVIRSWFRALDYYRAHPEEASASIAKYYRTTAEGYRKAVSGLRWIGYEEQDEPAEVGAQQKTFEAIAELKFRNGRISSKPSARDAIDPALRKDLYKR